MNFCRTKRQTAKASKVERNGAFLNYWQDPLRLVLFVLEVAKGRCTFKVLQFMLHIVLQLDLFCL